MVCAFLTHSVRNTRFGINNIATTYVEAEKNQGYIFFLNKMTISSKKKAQTTQKGQNGGIGLKPPNFDIFHFR